MDNPVQLKEMLEAMKRNPNLDKSSIRIILSKLKELRQSFRVTGEDGSNEEDEVLKYLEAEMAEGMNLNNRQTWEPTIYEYIAFFVVVVFIILVFGKIWCKLKQTIACAY